MKLSLLLLVGLFLVVFYDAKVESAALETADGDDGKESGASPENDGLHEIVKRQVRRQRGRQNRRLSRRQNRRGGRNLRRRTGGNRRFRFDSRDSRDYSYESYDSSYSGDRFYGRRGRRNYYYDD